MAESLPDIVAHIRAGVYTCAAGGTILLYDILLTTGEEIRLIWPSPFSFVKCLYFVVSPPPSPAEITWLTSPAFRIVISLSHV
jgi:Family of unknown function (DUF6533)